MDTIGLVGLMKMELPTATITYSDGGFFSFAGDDYTSSDAVFGTIGSLEPISESVGGTLPAFQMTFLPNSSAAAADISQPGFQNSRVRFWLGEFNPATGLIIGTPDLLFDGQVDRPVLVLGRGKRVLEIDIVTRVERLFLRDEGNSLTPSFHKSIWPGELGHDNAIDLELPLAWGVASPPRGTTGQFSIRQGVLNSGILR
jgi:hypothetical protein